MLQIVILAVTSSTACVAQQPENVSHPTPKSELATWPADTIILSDQPNSEIVIGKFKIHLFFNNDVRSNPFIVGVSPANLRKFIDELIAKGYYNPDQEVNFWYEFPGEVGETSSLDGDACLYGGRIDFTLNMGNALYTNVYIPYFMTENNLDDPKNMETFLAMAESQANYTFFHEARHIEHCVDTSKLEYAKDGVFSEEEKRDFREDKAKAENEAKKAETEWSNTIPQIFFLQWRQYASLEVLVKKLQEVWH